VNHRSRLAGIPVPESFPADQQVDEQGQNHEQTQQRSIDDPDAQVVMDGKGEAKHDQGHACQNRQQLLHPQKIDCLDIHVRRLHRVNPFHACSNDVFIAKL
jgi:hypothetical protein